MLARIGEVLDAGLVEIGQAGPTHLRVEGGRELCGSIDVLASKNATVALLCASLLNRGRTTLRRVARIEEVHRIIEVLRSIGVSVTWSESGTDLEIQPPEQFDVEQLDVDAARRTRSVLLLLGPLLHRTGRFRLPYAGGCDLGRRTVSPHLSALGAFGVDVEATGGSYLVDATPRRPSRPVVLVERGDTVTENALMVAAGTPGTTVIRNASCNYMVQDLCLFLRELGVGIDGLGTTTLTVEGVADIERDVEFT